MTSRFSPLRFGFLSPFGAVLVVLQLLLGAVSAPCAETIPLELELSIFLKIISYNRSLPASQEAFRVGMVPPRSMGAPDLQDLKKRIESFFAGKTLLGRPVVVDFLRSNALPAPDGPEGPDLLILHENPENEIESSLRFAEKRRILVFSTKSLHLEMGATVALSIENGQPVIQVNLTAARKLGADFHANFLKHCRVIK